MTPEITNTIIYQFAGEVGYILAINIAAVLTFIAVLIGLFFVIVEVVEKINKRK